MSSTPIHIHTLNTNQLVELRTQLNKERDELQKQLSALDAKLHTVRINIQRNCTHNWTVDRSMYGERDWFCTICLKHR